MDKKNVQKGVQAGLFWLLVPLGGAILVGWAASRFVVWLDMWAIAAVVGVIVSLVNAWRTKPKEGSGWSAGRIVSLIAALVLSGVAGYRQWQHLDWPISPIVGAVIPVVAGIGIAIYLAYRRGDEMDKASRTPDSQPHSPAAGRVTRKETVQATVGIPGRATTQLDVAAYAAQMGRSVAAQADDARAKEMEARLKMAQWLDGLRGRTPRFTDGTIDAAICELCPELKLSMPEPEKPKEQPTQRVLPAATHAGIEWVRRKR